MFKKLLLIASLLCAANLVFSTPQTSLIAPAHADSKVPAWVNGEVRRVVKQSNTIVIKHEEIAHIGMSAMTMPFKVKDSAMLDNIKPGDKIKFVVIEDKQDLLITQIKAQ